MNLVDQKQIQLLQKSKMFSWNVVYFLRSCYVNVSIIKLFQLHLQRISS
jgi:hypothetical protein